MSVQNLAKHCQSFPDDAALARARVAEYRDQPAGRSAFKLVNILSHSIRDSNGRAASVLGVWAATNQASRLQTVHDPRRGAVVHAQRLTELSQRHGPARHQASHQPYLRSRETGFPGLVERRVEQIAPQRVDVGERFLGFPDERRLVTASGCTLALLLSWHWCLGYLTG